MVLTACTSNYGRWLLHLHHNLRLLGLKLHVCAMDEATINIANSHGIRAIGEELFIDGAVPRTSAAHTYMWAAHTAINHRKMECVWRTLQTLPLGGRLLFTDADVTFYRDPFPLLLADPDADIAIMDDDALQVTPMLVEAAIGVVAVRRWSGDLQHVHEGMRIPFVDPARTCQKE